MSNIVSQRQRTATPQNYSKPTVIYDGVFASRSVEHRAWKNMHSRCKEQYAQHRFYFDKGIKVCDRWTGNNGFLNFFADLGRRPSSKHSVDRIDCSKGYEPSNCRWATTRQQAINRNMPHSRTSKYRGVCKQKNRESWLVAIDNIRVGSFSDEYTAALAYDHEAVKRHGIDAHLNFPQGVSYAI